MPSNGEGRRSGGPAGLDGPSECYTEHRNLLPMFFLDYTRWVDARVFAATVGDLARHNAKGSNVGLKQIEMIDCDSTSPLPRLSL